MVDRAAARRYAEAYVGTLEETDKVEEGLQALKIFAQAYTGSRDLVRFLGSPEISEEEKGQLLTRLLSDLMGNEGMGLVHLLLRWERIELTPAIYEEALAVMEARQGLLRGKVVTAHPISSSQVESIAKRLSAVLGKQVILERQVDPQLIGGVRILIASTLLDGSVQAALRDLKEQLLSVKVT